MDLFFYFFYLRMEFKANKNIYKNSQLPGKKETKKKKCKIFDDDLPLGP